jgi:hypothetical protein
VKAWSSSGFFKTGDIPAVWVTAFSEHLPCAWHDTGSQGHWCERPPAPSCWEIDGAITSLPVVSRKVQGAGLWPWLWCLGLVRWSYTAAWCPPHLTQAWVKMKLKAESSRGSLYTSPSSLLNSSLQMRGMWACESGHRHSRDSASGVQGSLRVLCTGGNTTLTAQRTFVSNTLLCDKKVPGHIRD